MPGTLSLTAVRLSSSPSVCAHSVPSDSWRPYGPWPARLFCPWNFPDKNTGVGCCFLFQGNPPDLGIEPKALVSPELASGVFTTIAFIAACLKVKAKLLSRVRLFATPWTAAYQAPLSMGFPRQEYWSGLPFPSPGDHPDPGVEPGSPAL